ncbi:MAG: hypothetical protein ACE5FC_10705 [Myxococcota bacterium]
MDDTGSAGMAHPFEWLSPPARRQAFIATCALAFAIMPAMAVFDGPLRTGDAPFGIVSFELARTAAKAGAILASWDAAARVSAGLSLGLDYLFLFAYALALALGCVLVGGLARNRGTWLAALAAPLAWSLLLAAVLDAVENYALIRLLLGEGGGEWPALAWGCAVPKFVAVALGLLYLTGGGLASALRGGGGKAIS